MTKDSAHLTELRVCACDGLFALRTSPEMHLDSSVAFASPAKTSADQQQRDIVSTTIYRRSRLSLVLIAKVGLFESLPF
ncbi:uncharacterized protein L969DRAFT_97184 [Mixia osmundae IAM 14324]|uniref:Uncharacterized protein n=1 Tax=Mixia osmundae (strain CBS 9802 / IAM 14324 / JCM 22182 / KY 12970) TaxID=764103 RepID=G7DW48_MIXOS|nr:uncharacterized protein L969DRAFT_97184 [Mixia osmundae IAM 14324]KEI36448.1 hypothetical protein L969DRAFT_97184 [Mixia osmundae IAM 14324]GAA94854.1 hypothetical protein E5Q_01508 [Mixia osmundae IAM 14324]